MEIILLAVRSCCGATPEFRSHVQLPASHKYSRIPLDSSYWQASAAFEISVWIIVILEGTIKPRLPL